MSSSPRIRGIVMMILAVAVFAVMDLCLKIVSNQLLPLQVATLRAVASLPFVLLGVVWTGQLRALRMRRYGLHLARGALSVVMIATYSYAVGHMSLSGVYTVFMVAPLMVTAISVPVFGEPVRLDAWIAIFVGLIGVVVVLGPDSGALSLAGSLAALASACCYTVNYVLARKLAPTESTHSLVFWVLALMALISGTAGYGDWQPVPAALWPAILATICVLRMWNSPNKEQSLLAHCPGLPTSRRHGPFIGASARPWSEHNAQHAHGPRAFLSYCGGFFCCAAASVK